jgi:hypothetical protein
MVWHHSTTREWCGLLLLAFAKHALVMIIILDTQQGSWRCFSDVATSENNGCNARIILVHQHDKCRANASQAQT